MDGNRERDRLRGGGIVAQKSFIEIRGAPAGPRLFKKSPGLFLAGGGVSLRSM